MKQITLQASKFITAFALALFLIPSLTMEVSARQDWVNVDGVVGGKIKYDTDTGFILDCETSVTSANIPNEINGVRIVGVGKGAFASCTKLESVYLPDTILLMEEGSYSSNGTFSNCTALKSVRLPEGIKTIPAYTFSGCSALTASSLTIPESVMIIGNYAFSGCKVLTTITIPDSVKEIGHYAFQSCTMLSHINLPENLTVIPSYMFTGCTLLTSIYIPSSVATVSNRAFADTKLLTDVYFSGTSSQWNSITIGSVNGDLTAAKIHFNSDAPVMVDSYYSPWAKDYVLSAAKNKLLPSSLGNDYTISITREQIAEMMVTLVETYTNLTLPTAPSSTFTDTANTSVLKAYQAGIVNGTGGTYFSPLQTATREQIAVMLHKAVSVIENARNKEITNKVTVLSGYTDFADVSSWAQDSVAILANNSIMMGTSNNILSPTNNTTIEQCIILALAVYNL